VTKKFATPLLALFLLAPPVVLAQLPSARPAPPPPRPADQARSTTSVCLFDICLGAPVARPSCMKGIPVGGCVEPSTSGVSVLFPRQNKPEMLLSPGTTFPAINVDTDARGAARRIQFTVVNQPATIQEFSRKFGNAKVEAGRDRMGADSIKHLWQLGEWEVAMVCKVQGPCFITAGEAGKGSPALSPAAPKPKL
jgi:hypothetical protein